MVHGDEVMKWGVKRGVKLPSSSRVRKRATVFDDSSSSCCLHKTVHQSKNQIEIMMMLTMIILFKVGRGARDVRISSHWFLPHNVMRTPPRLS